MPLKMDHEYITTAKGMKKLNVKNYLFNKNSQCGPTTYWQCEMYKKIKCRARATTVDGEIVHINNVHNYTADAGNVEAIKIYFALREQAAVSREPPQAIMSSALTNCSQVTVSKLTSKNNMKRTIQNIRFKNNSGLALPQNRQEIEFPVDFTKLSTGNEFLFYDSGNIENRILIFATKENIQLLERCEHWYADGTFKTCPSLFYQLYTLHGFRNDTHFPLVYALLPDKNQATYKIFLNAVKDYNPMMSPISITTDYERAIMNACHDVFPATEHRGCFFHFTQCIMRSIQSFGLKNTYESDPDFALKLRMLSVLAFILKDKVIDAFDTMIDNNNFPTEAQEVIDYFEDNWIGRCDRRVGRRLPRFSIEIWSL